MNTSTPSPTLRIAVFTTSYPRHRCDDVSVFVQRFVTALTELCRSILVIVPLDADEPICLQEERLTILRFRYGLFSRGRLAFGAGLLPNLQRKPGLILQAPLLVLGLVWTAWRRRKEIDVVQANWILAGAAALFYKTLTGTPYILTLRGSDMKLIGKTWLRQLYRPIINGAATVVTVNAGFCQEVQSLTGLKEKRIVPIPNGVEIHPPTPEQLINFRRSYTLAAPLPYLMTAATVIPLKRIALLIELLAQPILSNYHLLICGKLDDSAYVAELRKQIRLLNLEERVHLLGLVPPLEIPCCLAASRCYVTASSFEGRPNAVLEAFAAGLPVFAADIPAHRELIQDGVNGFLFDTANLTALAARIVQLEEDRRLRETIIANALKKTENMSWRICAAAYYQILSDSLQKS